MKRALVLFVLFAVFSLTFIYPKGHPKWHLKVNSLSVDNCPMTACPCLLGGLPYHGVCHAVGVWEIVEGKYGNLDLSGQVIGFIVDFHKMDKLDDMGFYIDKNASTEVKSALKDILSNKPFGLVGKDFKIKETTLKSNYISGQESSFAIGEIASLTLTPLIGGDGKNQMSIKNPMDPFGAKEVFLNNGKGFYNDYGKKLKYNDNSGEIEQFEISSDVQPMETDKKEMEMN